MNPQCPLLPHGGSVSVGKSRVGCHLNGDHLSTSFTGGGPRAVILRSRTHGLVEGLGDAFLGTEK